MMEATLSALKKIVGSDYILTGAALEPFETDWRGRYCGKALCAAYPANTAEVSALMAYCYAHGLPMVPQGGNTGLCGGATPNTEGQSVIIGLQRLSAIRDLDPVNNTLTLEAGCLLANAQSAADSANRLFPLSLASEGSCQIGGNLSTNAGGIQVLRYGNMRDLTLGLEVVLPNGEIWDGLRALRKDNTGYDLKHLFMGAEGTLGVITAAVVKLFPKPQSTLTAWLNIPSPTAAIALLNRAQEAFPDALNAFELISENSLGLVLAHIPGTRRPTSPSPWYSLCEFSGSYPEETALSSWVGRFLEVMLAEGLLTDAVLAHSEAQARTLWALRENISEAQKREGFSIKHDIAVPVSRIPEFLAGAGHELEQAYPGIRIVAFGHAGDGNLHYNLSHPAHAADGGRAFLAHQQDINTRVHNRVNALRGSISAEHGLGQLKCTEIRHYKSPVEMALMASLKKAIDPKGLMNPGKVLLGFPQNFVLKENG